MQQAGWKELTSERKGMLRPLNRVYRQTLLESQKGNQVCQDYVVSEGPCHGR